MFPSLIVRDWVNIWFVNPFKLSEGIQTFDELVKENPDLIQEFEKIQQKTKNHPDLIGQYQQLEPDILDEDLTELVINSITKKLKSKNIDKDICEKYTKGVY